jgi:hypothetical protein
LPWLKTPVPIKSEIKPPTFVAPWLKKPMQPIKSSNIEKERPYEMEEISDSDSDKENKHMATTQTQDRRAQRIRNSAKS